jgi:hypothetical protein
MVDEGHQLPGPDRPRAAHEASVRGQVPGQGDGLAAVARGHQGVDLVDWRYLV